MVASVSCGRKRNKENKEKKNGSNGSDGDGSEVQCGVEYYWVHGTEYKTECTQSYHTECTHEYITECGYNTEVVHEEKCSIEAVEEPVEECFVTVTQECYHPRYKRDGDHTLYPLGPPHHHLEVHHQQCQDIPHQQCTTNFVHTTVQTCVQVPVQQQHDVCQS